MFATFAFATYPVTFAPVIELNPLPFATMLSTVSVLLVVVKVKLALAPKVLLLLLLKNIWLFDPLIFALPYDPGLTQVRFP